MGDYWIDANVLIESKKGPYAFDLAPGFWRLIEEKGTAGVISTSTMVFSELVGETDDGLADWAKQRRTSGLFVEPDEAVQANLSKIADYVKSAYPEAEVSRFLSGADPWLIAHAMTYGGIVVTFEKKVPANSQKAKIPNVCEQFTVPYLGPYEMLRQLGASFN